MKKGILLFTAILAIVFSFGCAGMSVKMNDDTTAVASAILGHRLGYAMAEKNPAKVLLYSDYADDMLAKMQTGTPGEGLNIAIMNAFSLVAAELSADPLLAADLRSVATLIVFEIPATDPDFTLKYQAYLAAIRAGVAGFKEGVFTYQITHIK